MDASDEVGELLDVPEPLEGSNARATGVRKLTYTPPSPGG